MAIRVNYKKAVGKVLHVGKSVGRAIGHAGSRVYKDGKSAVSTVYKDTFSFAKSFTPAGIVGAFSSPGGFGILGIAAAVGVAALLILRK